MSDRRIVWRRRGGRGLAKYRVALTLALVVTGMLAAGQDAVGQDKTVVTVNGRAVLESELALADAEIGAELGNLPAAMRRRVLVEYLIETQLMAEAAETAALGQGASFDQRMQYWRRKALRDSYFDNKIKSMVTEADARREFAAQSGQGGSGVEISVRHILVDSEDKAREIYEEIAHGADFASLARRHSKDLITRNSGGVLSPFVAGRVAPQLEAVVAKLGRGEVSQPVRTGEGWHIVRLDGRRTRQLPPFEAVKTRIMAELLRRRAQDALETMRARARVDYHDPEIRAQIAAERGQGPGGGAGGGRR